MLEHHMIGDYSIGNLKYKLMADVEFNDETASLAIEQLNSHPIAGKNSRQIIVEGGEAEIDFFRVMVEHLKEFNGKIEEIYSENFSNHKNVPIDSIINPLDLLKASRKNLIKIKLNPNLVQDDSLTTLEKFYGVMVLSPEVNGDRVLTSDDKRILKGLAKNYLNELSVNYKDYREYIITHRKEVKISDAVFTAGVYGHLIKNNIQYNYVNAHNMRIVMSLITGAGLKIREMSKEEFLKIFQLHSFINGEYKNISMDNVLDSVLNGSENKIKNIYSLLEGSEKYLTKNASHNMKRNVVAFGKLTDDNYSKLTSMHKPCIIELLQNTPTGVKGELVNDVFQGYKEFKENRDSVVLNEGVAKYVKVIEKFPELSRSLHLESHSLLVGMCSHKAIIEYFMASFNELSPDDYEGLEKLILFIRDNMLYVNNSFIISNIIVKNLLNNGMSLKNITEIIAILNVETLKKYMAENEITTFQLKYSKNITEYLNMPIEWVIGLQENER